MCFGDFGGVDVGCWDAEEVWGVKEERRKRKGRKKEERGKEMEKEDRKEERRKEGRKEGRKRGEMICCVWVCFGDFGGVGVGCFFGGGGGGGMSRRYGA